MLVALLAACSPTPPGTTCEDCDPVVIDAGALPSPDAGRDPTDAGPEPLADAGTDPVVDAGTDPTPDAGTEPVVDAGPGPVTDPAAPQGFTATAVGAAEIDLAWLTVPEASGYRVYRDDVLITTPAVAHYEDLTVAAASTHRYFVRALVEGRESPPSVVASATAHRADESGDLVAGDLRAERTIQSIGLQWSLSGDRDHDATATVHYRATDSWRWNTAMPLLRVDFNGQNDLAGSLLYLEPGTEYEIVAYATDPDGGARTQRLRVTTREVPTLPTGGRTLHVKPGSGGGDGSSGSPFLGVAAASSAARPGDVMLLHAGRYAGRALFTTAGDATKRVGWKAAGDGAPIFDGIEVRASHQYFEGLRIEAGGGYDFPIGIRTANAPADVAVVRCEIVGNHYSIWLNAGGSDWYIADNTIVGDNAVTSESFSGEGVELQHTAGHVVSHNRISQVGDGVSYCDRNCDIVGNDIFDTSDDGVELDFGYANIRVIGNRLHNTGHNGVSFQPQQGAPWYVLRNQIIGNSEGPLKYRGTDRFVFAHNTLVAWAAFGSVQGEEFLNAFSRNNVWISVNGGAIWNFGSAGADWRTSLDADGFDWGGNSAPFRAEGATFRDLATFASATGLEQRGLQLARSCFPTLDMPKAPPASVPAHLVTLASGCRAIDAGIALPNLNDGFRGAAPDLGAYESGAPAPIYGPR